MIDEGLDGADEVRGREEPGTVFGQLRSDFVDGGVRVRDDEDPGAMRKRQPVFEDEQLGKESRRLSAAGHGVEIQGVESADEGSPLFIEIAGHAEEEPGRADDFRVGDVTHDRHI